MLLQPLNRRIEKCCGLIHSAIQGEAKDEVEQSRPPLIRASQPARA